MTTEYEEPEEELEPEVEEDDGYCYACAGTGEGQYAGARCVGCGGKGFRLPHPDEDYEPPEPDYDDYIGPD